MTTSPRLAFVFLVLAGAPAIALADKPDDAKAHVAKATKAHKDGRYDEARVELEAAYALDPRPDLLYALGQVHAKLGNCREAVGYFKRFVATQRDPKVARVVDQAIAACTPAPTPPPPPERDPQPTVAASSDPPPAREPPPVVAASSDSPSDVSAASPEPARPPANRAGSSRDTARPPPPAPRPRPFGPSKSTAPVHVARSPWYTDKLGDGLVLGGVAVAVVSAIEYRAALSNLDAAEDRTGTTTQTRYRELIDGAHGKRMAALVLAGASGVLLTVGIVRFVNHDRSAETGGVGIAPARGGGLVTYGGSF